MRSAVYEQDFEQDNPNNCRTKCDRDSECAGFVYDKKLKQCNYHKSMSESNLRYYPGRITFWKYKN